MSIYYAIVHALLITKGPPAKILLQPQENHAKRSEFSWNPNAMEPQNVILSNSINGRKFLRSSANHVKQITMLWDMKFCGRSGVPPNIMYILGFEETFFRFVAIPTNVRHNAMGHEVSWNV